MGLKLGAMTLLIFAYGFGANTLVLLSGPAALLILGSIAGQSPGGTARYVKAPLILLLFMSPFIIFMPGETRLFAQSSIPLYRESLMLFFTIALRSVTVFGLLAFLVQGSRPDEIGSSLRKIGIPGKLVIIFLSTWRYINLYAADLGQLVRSAKLRGFSLRRGLAHWGTSADILLTLLIRSYEQSERVQAAMTTRGFTGEMPENFTETALTVRERIFSLTALVISIIIFAAEYRW